MHGRSIYILIEIYEDFIRMGGGEAAHGGDDSSNRVGEEVTVDISCANGSEFSVHLYLDSTVEFFKSILARKCGIPIHQQRLIYRGRILKDDQTLRSYGLEADHTVYLVRSFATAVPAETAASTDAGVRSTNPISSTGAGSSEGVRRGGSEFGSSLSPGLGLTGLESAMNIFQERLQQLIQNPDMLSNMFNMPSFQNIINNPETIRNVIVNNPQLSDIMDRNPELARILNDPSGLRQTVEALRDPDIMRETMREVMRLHADDIVHIAQIFEPGVPAEAATTADAGFSEDGPLGGSAFGSSLFPGLGLDGLGSASDIFEQLRQQLTQNPNMIRDISNMPFVQNIMNNPETIRNIITDNPQMREFIDRNPDIAHILNDPETLRQAMEPTHSPEIMRERMRNNDRAMSNIESFPGGFNMLRQMYENVQEPLEALLGAQVDRLGSWNSNSSVSAGLEVTTNSSGPNTRPLPNPWNSAGAGGVQTNFGIPVLERTPGSMPVGSSSNQLMQNPSMYNIMENLLSSPQYMNQQLQSSLSSQLGSQPSVEPGRNAAGETGRNVAGETVGTTDNMGFDMLMNMFRGLGTVGGMTTPNSSQVPPEELYATQLSQLREMGFIDTQENIRALIAAAGNVSAAVERLVGNSDR
ncbi:hypothetical protein ACP275_08G223700 [Erythranthe tilingii]